MFGRVYLAERTDVPEHRVALKVIHRSVYGGRDVRRELVMLAATTHPNIVQLKDHGVTADHVWLTMPLYEGETLAQRLERGPLTLREAYDVFRPIARGVHALHERGLRHQDIKPENIFLADIGGEVHPVLLDLGVAVESSSPFVAGTALYGSPEQLVALGGLEGRGELSEKMDTYCLAATLLRSLVGADAFPGESASSPFEIANAFCEREERPLRAGSLPSLTDEPRALLSAAFSRWLTRDADARPDAGRFADELDVLLEQEREAATAIERQIALQLGTLKRFRVGFMVVLAAGAGLFLWGLTHRETLRLARELERARAIGADSFDKLDTCVAAHKLAEHQTASCEAAREEERAGLEATLTETRTSFARTKADLERNLGREKRRVRACADEKHLAAKSCESEREKLEETIDDKGRALTSANAEITKLRKERDDEAADGAVCQGKLDQAVAAQSSCDQKLATCVAERDAPDLDVPPSDGGAPVSAKASGGGEEAVSLPAIEDRVASDAPPSP
jgi:hypothetical protein